MKVFVNGGKRRGTAEVTLPSDATVDQLINAYRGLSKIHPTRQAYKFKKSPTSDEVTRFSIVQAHKTLASFGVTDGVTVEAKDVGPQFSYRGVFFFEYFGPLVIMLLFSTRPAAVYGPGASDKPFTYAAKLGVGCYVAHYAKRLFETFFVHRFSRPTMPLTNLFKNCGYYWSFTALIAYYLCSPSYSEPSSAETSIGFVVFVIAELLNAAVHLYLRSIRPPTDSSRRMPPTGPLFSLVTSPNYTAEVSAWIGYAVMLRLLSVYLFAIAGLYQMTVWALGKYRGYLKTDKAYARSRKAIIPFVL